MAVVTTRLPPGREGTGANAEVRDAGSQPDPTQQVDVPIPANLVQELRDLLRERDARIARQDDRLTQIEEQVAFRRANTAPVQRHRRHGSPLLRANPSRRHRSPPRRQLVHRSPPRRRGRGGGLTPPSTPPSSDYSYWPEESTPQDSSYDSSDSTARSSSRSHERYRPMRSDEYSRLERHRHPNDRSNDYSGVERRRDGRRHPEGRARHRDLVDTSIGPFTRDIDDFRIPRSLEKPPSDLKMYSGVKDPVAHVRHFELMMKYRGAPGPVKCKIFPLTLEGSALEWFTELPPNSISSWDQLARVFTARFTTSRVKPKSEDALLGVRQEPNESLRSFIERFNQEADQVKNLPDHQRLFFLRTGLLRNSRFQEEVGLNKPRDLETFLRRAQRFIDYEETTRAIETAEAGFNHQPREGRWERPRREEDRPPRDSRKKFADRTRLNASYEQILSECANTEFRNIKRPEPLVLKEGQHPSKKYCHYHRSHGHDTNQCMALKDDVEALIRKGKLSQYVRRNQTEAREDRQVARSPRKGKAPADEVPELIEGEENKDEGMDNRKSRGRAVAMVIMGGIPTDRRETNKSMKRRWEQIMSVASTSAPRPPSKRRPISFGDEDLLDGTPNHEVPLVISAVMANVEVKRILVDQGSSADIIFEDLLDVLRISRKDLRPYRGTVLTGFNGSTTTPIGRIELMVTFEGDTAEKPLSRTVRTDFIVLPCKSIYQCLIGRPTLSCLEAVPSTVHLKMKFYTNEGEIATIQADLLSAKRAFFLSLKEQGDQVRREIEDAMKGGEVNMADLDARYDPDSEEEEGDEECVHGQTGPKLGRPLPRRFH